jgi:hypothetical protein
MQGHAFNHQQQIWKKKVSNKNSQNCRYMRLVFLLEAFFISSPRSTPSGGHQHTKRCSMASTWTFDLFSEFLYVIIT